jgi:Protein of unknown function (DUF2924)
MSMRSTQGIYLEHIKYLYRPALFWAEHCEIKPFLVKRLAYRLQELAYGGLSARAEAKLKELIEEEDRRIKGKLLVRKSDRPIVGTRLIRQWQGVEHTATVVADGYEYQGRPYKSVSAVARAITGTRWSGPLFWGLRNYRSGK